MIRRLLLLLTALPVGLVLGVVVYASAARIGLVPNPFAPVTRGDLSQARSDRPGLRILFVGNSFTYRNDLPGIVHGLGGGKIFAVSFTAGGWRLHDFAHNRSLERLLGQANWDYVVLQEQSRIPSLPASVRAREFQPYVLELTQAVAARHERPLLFLTWGYRGGDRRNVAGDTYAAMQQRLVDGERDAARASGAVVVPIGLAWREALMRRPELDLWAGDGKHPSRLGSYLAACVFYATVTGHSPVGNGFTDGLDPNDARFLQAVAWGTVRAPS